MPSRYIWTPPRRNTEDPNRPPLPGMEHPAPRVHPGDRLYHASGNAEVWGHLAHPDLQRHNPFLVHPQDDEVHGYTDSDAGRSWANEYGGYADRYEGDVDETPEHGPERVERHLRRAIGKALPAMAVSGHALRSILDSGHVKSQFETSTSRGLLSPETRADVEHQFFGYPTDMPAKARPIYGYLTHNPAVQHAGVEGYGEHSLILHRPRIWHRTSAFIGDTLDHRYEGHMAHPVQDFKLSGLPRYADLKDWRLDRPNRDWDIPYTEAHYHGGVGLRDVHYAVLHHRNDRYHDNDTEDLEKLLNHHKIPWVRMVDSKPEEWQHHLSQVNRAVARGAFMNPDAKVIGHQGHERYLIDLGYRNENGDQQAQVADIRNGKLHRPRSKDSILARGYWEEPGVPVELDDILPHVLPA